MMLNHRRRGAAWLVAVAWLTGCSAKEPTAELLRSRVAHDTTPDLSDAQYASYIAGHNAFGLELFTEVCGGDSNCVLSPTSAYVTLSMLYAGTTLTTAEQTAQALRSELSAEVHHAGSNRFMMELEGRNHGTVGSEPEGQGVVLHLADSLWVDNNLQIAPDYLATLSSQYDTGIYQRDFQQDPSGTAQAINAWASESTQGLITDIVDDPLPQDERLVAANALYFEGTWAGGPLEQSQQPVIFTCVDGHQVSAPFLKGRASSYASTDAGQMLQVPYDGGDLSLMLFLPTDGTWEQARQALLTGQLPITQEQFQPADVYYSFPVAELAPPTFDLVGTLRDMGMTALFQPGALDGMAKEEGLTLTRVRQKAFLRMDAKGTVAAAVTAAEGEIIIGSPTQPVYLNFNRSFFFAVEDASGALLFIGQVTDPTA
jgi:serpin B